METETKCEKCGGDTCDHRRAQQLAEAEYEIGVLREERDAACREGRDVLARLMELRASLSAAQLKLAEAERREAAANESPPTCTHELPLSVTCPACGVSSNRRR